MLHGGIVILQNHPGLRRRCMEINLYLFFLGGKRVFTHGLRLFDFVQSFQSSHRRGQRALRQRRILGGGISVRRISDHRVVSERARIQRLITSPCIHLIAQRDHLVGVLDYLWIIFELAISLVIQWVDINQQRRIWILGYKIVQRLYLRGRIFVRRGSLVGGVLRHGVLWFGARCILPRGRSLRRLGHCADGLTKIYTQRRDHREAYYLLCSSHSDFSSLKLQPLGLYSRSPGLMLPGISAIVRKTLGL